MSVEKLSMSYWRHKADQEVMGHEKFNEQDVLEYRN